jgi:hypothetical protein
MKQLWNIFAGIFLINSLLCGPAFAQKAAPGFVSMPSDISCSIKGMSFMAMVGANGQLVQTDGSANGMTCALTGKSAKDIALASHSIKDGRLPTKEFGNLQIDPTNNLNSTSVYIAISKDKLKAFRDYLLK